MICIVPARPQRSRPGGKDGFSPGFASLLAAQEKARKCLKPRTLTSDKICRTMQSSARDPRGAHPVVVEYMSDEGPTVTHLRGSVLVACFHALRTQSLYERYLTYLPAPVRDELVNTLAMSWVTSEHFTLHCAAVDALSLSARDHGDLGRIIAEQMGSSSLSSLWRGAQSMGVGSGWWAIKQADRLWPRMYRGGGCSVLQSGPKDAIFESHGVPMIGSPFFRACYYGFMTSIGKLLGATCYVKQVSPRVPHPHRIAIAFSWV